MSNSEILNAKSVLASSFAVFFACFWFSFDADVFEDEVAEALVFEAVVSLADVAADVALGFWFVAVV